jgi:hypothetical protein
MTLIVDDAQLLRMTAEPPRDAVPALSQAVSFEPIVWLLAVVPPLVLLTRSGLDAESASWGLRALAVVQANRIMEWLIPGTTFSDTWQAWLPPLQSWLTALTIELGPVGAIAPTLLISTTACAALVLVLYAWLREAAGPRVAFLAAMMLGLHPQFLLMAGSGRPEGLTAALLVACAWGLWGHWQGPRTFVSVRLLCAGIAWGLAVLAGGPVALAAAAGLIVYWFWEGGRSLTLAAGDDHPATLQLGRGVVLLIITGGALSFWWVTLLLADGGLPFLDVWLRLAPPRGELPAVVESSSWRLVHVWLCRSAFLAGWWLIGLQQAVRWRQTTAADGAHRLARWMVCWLLVGVALRFAPVLFPALWPAAVTPWEAWLTLPIVVLAAQGLDAVLRREVSNRVFVGALTLTVGMVLWAFTGRALIGLIVAVTFALTIYASAPLALGLRRTSMAWTETGIRRWMQAAAAMTLCGPILLGWWLIAPRDAEVLRYAELRTRLSQVPEVQRISVIGEGHAPPPALVFLLRSLWPKAKLAVTDGWDPQLTDTIVTEAGRPRSRLLVVEWSRKELRLRTEVGEVWQVTQVVDPIAYGQRRLAVQLIAPAERL